MRKGICRSFVVLFSVTLLAAGCAKQELVKKDEPVTPATPPAAATPTQPVKETKISQQTVQEAPVAMKEEAVSKDSAAAQSQGLEKVYFDFDSFVLTATARDVLSKDAEQIIKKIQGKIQIEGHCDERGSDEYNLALGEKRARAAMNYLVTLGVPADRLSIISYGKEKPAEKGTGEAIWAKNRRAEFVVR